MAQDTWSKQQVWAQRRHRIQRERQRGMMLMQRVTSSDVYLPPKNQLGTSQTYGTQRRVVVIKTAQNLGQEVAY